MFRFSKFVTVALAAAVIMGAAGVRTTSAQSSYVNTFDLKLASVEGDYKGVDPKGTTVTWWHQHTGAREETVKALVDQFNKENPFGITVQAVSKGSYDDIFTAMTAGIQTGELPEIAVAYGNQAAAYQDNNALIDLNTFVNDAVLGIGDDFTKDMYSSFFDSDVRVDRGGQRLGYSTYRSMEVLYYNVDALTAMGFKAPPKNWAEFGEQVCKFKNDGLGTDGYQIRTDASQIAAGAFAQGGNIFDAKADQFTYDSDAAKVLPKAIVDLLNKGCIIKTTDAKARSDQASFGNGQSLFYMGSSSGIPFIADAIKAAPKQFAFDVAPIPYSDKPIQNVYGASNSLVGLKKSKEQILAGWLFLRWFSESDPQSQWSHATNYFPVRRSAADKLTDMFEKPNSGVPFKSAFDLLGSTLEEPAVAVYQTVRSEAAKAFNNILDGASVDDEMARLNDLANKLHEEARAKEKH